MYIIIIILFIYLFIFAILVYVSNNPTGQTDSDHLLKSVKCTAETEI